ncbi:MAG: amidohydrolase family protein [Gemmatimonadetes bacterium]|nr:amidohydrolase family protein [Gemmatimonadota bacterium]
MSSAGATTASRGRGRPVALGAISLVAAGCAESGSLVVAGATVIDGTGAPSLPNARIVVVDEHIACVGGADACETPDGADVLDAAGFWVIPGLIDTNVGVTPARPDERREVLRFLLGVTTAGVDVPEAPTRDMEEWVFPAPESTPRWVARADPGLAAVDDVLDLLPAVAAAPEPTARASRTAALTRWLEFDPEALDSAAVALASGTRLETRLVARELWGAPYRLPHGLHQLLQLPMVTLALQDRALSDRTEAEVAELDAALALVRSFVRRFHEAGGSLATGTAGTLAPGLALHEEMRALVDAGLSPEAALYAATREAANALGVGDTRGTLEPGKLGDFLIVEGDPTLDIANAQTISRVVKGGVLYDPPTLFDDLIDEPGRRLSAGRTRLYIGLATVILTVLVTWRAVDGHRRRHGRNWT